MQGEGKNKQLQLSVSTADGGRLVLDKQLYSLQVVPMGQCL